jgi:hypothetical protein
MVEGEELGAIARRVIDPNRFMTIGTADEEGVPGSRRYAPAEYREFFWVSDPEARHSRNIAARLNLPGQIVATTMSEVKQFFCCYQPDSSSIHSGFIAFCCY